MQFNCPHCQYLLKVPDNAAGRTGTCPKCHNKVRVPSGEPSEPTTVPCPFCAEMISPKAIKCRFCGEFLDSRNGGSRGNVDDRESNHRSRHSTARHGAVSSSPNNGAANGWDNGAGRESGHRARHRTARHGSVPTAPSNSRSPGVTEFGGLFGMSWRSLGVIAVVVVILGVWALRGNGEAQKSKTRIERGEQAPKTNNYTKAEELFERAQQSFALQTDEGRHKAVEFCRKAAELGHAEAQYLLGVFYQMGVGVAHDEYEAVKWFRNSANQGCSKGQYALGKCYYDGDVLPKDYRQAVVWFRKSAEQGNATGQCLLGLCLYKGQGVDKSISTMNEGVGWIQKAAEQGNEEASEILKKISPK